MKQQGFSFDLSQRAQAAAAIQCPAPITLVRGFLNVEQQQALMQEAQHYPFERPQIRVYGQYHPIPRSQVWFADKGCDYRYSNLFIEAIDWPKYAQRCRDMLTREFGLQSNGVLVNRYRDGNDTMGWHSDDEVEIKPGSDIASLTLGASRDFLIRHKQTKARYTIALTSGDLLIMHWPMQQEWQHSLPKRKAVSDCRLNYTFRQLVPNFHSNR